MLSEQNGDDFRADNRVCKKGKEYKMPTEKWKHEMHTGPSLCAHCWFSALGPF
jgi:hypothetical protein